MAFGRLMPLITRNSNALSRLAESDISFWRIGLISLMSPRISLESTLSLA